VSPASNFKETNLHFILRGFSSLRCYVDESITLKTTSVNIGLGMSHGSGRLIKMNCI
jgi:hypothetical protein